MMILILPACLGFYLLFQTESEVVKEDFDVGVLKSHINSQITNNHKIEGTSFNSTEGEFNIKYSFDDKLSNYVEKRLRYYRPDRAAVVVLESNSGKILTSVGFERKTMSFDNLLPFTGTHPSASVFKIVTSAELLEDHEVSGDDLFKYRGRGTTLYRYQLKDKKSKWRRTSSFERAFAFSNNVVFGKAAIQNTTPFELKEMAERFGFNKKIMKEVDIAKSTFIMPEDGYNLAEIASGFNKDTLMSPVHCAGISSVVANDGEYVNPRLVLEVEDKDKNIVWKNTKETQRVLDLKTNAELKDLMSSTVKKGTARKHFRGLRRKLRKELEIGGKTGSITGGLPFGKRDWFSAFAIPKQKKEQSISVCVMIINYKKWYVRSAKLAQDIIQYYYTKVNKL